MALIINGERIEDSEIKKEVERLRPDYEKAMAEMDPKEREEQLLEWSKENVIEGVLYRQELKKTSDQIPNARIEELLTRLKDRYKDPQNLYKTFNVQGDENIKELIGTALASAQKSDQICRNIRKPSQADIRQYYRENKEQFMSGEQLLVAQIIKCVDWRTDEAAAFDAIKKAHEELKSGAAFEEVADK